MRLDQITLALEPHIRFAKAQIQGHDWDPPVREELASLLDRLESRIADKVVNIAVAGEFSSGKSSVINALLGTDLLATDDMPDTTLVPTVIQYSDRPVFMTTDTKGLTRCEKISIDEIRRRLSAPPLLRRQGESEEAFTKRIFQERKEEDRKASSISHFTVGLPSDFLKRGLRIIDTPGLNSWNARCVEVTHRCLTRADASIIVGTATAGGLKESFREELRHLLCRRLIRSIVVYTHCDYVSRRDRLAMYLQAVTPTYFDLTPDQLPVLMMVPPTVSAAMRGERFGDDHEELLALTRTSIERIVEYALERRIDIIVDDLTQLTTTLFDRLQESIHRLSTEGRNTLAQLERSRTSPLDPFLAKRVPPLKEAIKDSLDKQLTLTLTEIDKIVKNSNEVIMRPMQAQPSLEQLDRYVKDKLPDRLAARAQLMTTQAQTGRKECVSSIQTHLFQFDQELREESRRLDVLAVSLGFKPDSLGQLERKFDKTMERTVKFSEDEVKRQNNAIGGAVVGAIIGSFFTLGLGTAIGAAVGAWFGGDGKTASVKKACQRLKPEFDKILSEELGDHRDQLSKALTEWVEDAKSRVNSWLTVYATRYGMEVKRKIEEEERRLAKTRSHILELERNLEEITKHKTEISNIWKIK